LSVQRILSQRPQFLKNEKNIFGHNPIHLAIGWRDGLELLLKAADHCLLHQGTEILYRSPGCYTASTTLDFAIAFGCTESIRLLADTGIAFDIKWNLFVGTGVWDPEFSNLVLTIIIERLRQLLEFGRHELPTDIFDSLEITSFDSFDSKARALLDALHAEDISLPPKFKNKHRWDAPMNDAWWKDFWLPDGSFFHQPGMCTSTAMALFQAGFTSVDTEATQLTPLANLYIPFDIVGDQSPFWLYFPMVEFLVERGARLDRRIPSLFITIHALPCNNVNSFQIIHRIASIAWMGAIGLGVSDAIAIAKLGSSRIWHQILQSNASDSCICACASGGCRPISLAVKLAGTAKVIGCRSYPCFDNYATNWTTILNPHKWEKAVELLFTLTLLLNDLAGEQLVEDVIRFLTFSALGLTHTCCSHVASPGMRFEWGLIQLMDPIDIGEIREEEGEMIKTLDCLMDCFMADFRERGLPLSEFLLGSWQETMLAELTKEDEIPKGVMEQLDKLGVVLNIGLSSDDDDVESHGDGTEELKGPKDCCCFY
jgi:hypothetical protein